MSDFPPGDLHDEQDGGSDDTEIRLRAAGRSAATGIGRGCIVYLVCALAASLAMLAVLVLIWTFAPEPTNGTPSSSPLTTTALQGSTSTAPRSTSTSTPARTAPVGGSPTTAYRG